jgi:hypothetical protein
MPIYVRSATAVETLLTARIVHSSKSSPTRDYGSIEMTVTDRGANVSESLPF